MNCKDENIRERILLKRAIEHKDTNAVSELYDKYKPFLNKYLANLAYLDGYAEDLAHDVFLAISLGECEYNGDTDVQGYLCGMAKKLALSSKRKEARQGIIFTNCIPDKIAQASSYEPIEKLQLEDFRSALYLQILKLPKKSRQAVELVLIYNLRPHQAAKKLGC